MPHGVTRRAARSCTPAVSGFQAIRAKLPLEEQNLRLLEHDLTNVKTDIGRAAGAPLEADKLRQILQDFDLLFAVANAQERADLLRLIIKRIVFRGRYAESREFEFSSALAPKEGIEPPPRRLTAACSTTELLRNAAYR